jgi:hypothetical protein
MHVTDNEMVEILFARGLVKVLFATETFAMVHQSVFVLITGRQYACENCGIFRDQET